MKRKPKPDTARKFFIPALIELVQSASPSAKLKMARAIDETWGGSDAFNFKATEALSAASRRHALFHIFAIINDAAHSSRRKPGAGSFDRWRAAQRLM